MEKTKGQFILLQILLWVMALMAMAVLWDRWLLDGPYGPYRWVGMDFAPYWVGVQEMLAGANPYSPATTLKIQTVVYGGPALGEDPMMFVYPAWIFILIAPFALVPYKWAAILYSGSLLWAMLNFLYQIAARLGNKKFLAQSVWLVLLVLGSLPFLVISVIKGQLGYLSLLALFVTYQTAKQRPLLAGIVLGFALIKPTAAVAPVAGFLLWALLHKDWKFLWGFTGCLVVLLTTSFLASGNWVPSYFEVLNIRGGMPALWSIEILSAPWNIFYSGLFIGIGLFSIYLSFKRNHRHWFPAVILIGIALTPMRWIYDLFLGILILVDEREFSRPQSLLTGVAVLSPWVLILAPEAMRWSIAVIGLPLIWAVVLLASYVSKETQVV